MKKLFNVSLVALCATAFVACSSEDMPVPGGENGMTTFTVQLPADMVSTRAYGEASLAKKLYVAIYDHSGTATDAPLISNFPGSATASSVTVVGFDTPASGNPTATVTVPLVKDKAYDIVFWAQDESQSAYTYSETDRTITVSYDGMTNYDESRDAFYANLKNFTSTGSGENVTLYRPFAQLNVGTDDYAAYLTAADLQSQEFGMKVTGVSDVLNLFTDEISASATDLVATVANAAPSANTEAFPVEGKNLQYLAMGYFLVGSDQTDKATLDVDLAVGDNAAFDSYSNIPAQKNYRTNIYGSLLTNTENINVTIDPSWETPDNNIVYENGVYNISTPEGLVAFANNITSGKTYAGETVVLNCDLDMTGIAWAAPGPINEGANNNFTHLFAGTFDGQGHTISNLSCTSKGYRSSVGLFGAITGYVKNVNLKNVTLDGAQYIGCIAAYLETGAGTIPTVTDCNVDGATITSAGYIGKVSGAGGIVGYSEGHTTISGCSVTGLTANVTASDAKLGGILGMTALSYITDCSISDSSLTVTSDKATCDIYYGGSNPDAAKISGCTNENVTVTKP